MNQKYRIFQILISLFIFPIYIFADAPEKKNSNEEKISDEQEKKESKEDEPPKIGNFSLPTSQQPAALFGFGGNIIDAKEVQLYLFGDYFLGKRRIVSDIIPSVLFGITDDWSIFFNFPFAPELKDGSDRSSGLEDFFVQLEYAFYTKKTRTYMDQATVVFNVTVPTGSIHKQPETGFGSSSFFLGGTYYHVMTDWFLFTSQGAILMTSDNRTKFGDQFLYQFGVGRNITASQEHIYAWMFEIDGEYNKKNRIHGKIDPNSGGNVIYATPSIWFSTKTFLLQFGISFPVNQNFFGKQNKFDYALNINLALSFY